MTIADTLVAATEPAAGAESSGDSWRVYRNKDGGHELAVWVATGVRRKMRIPRKYAADEDRARFAKGAAAEMRRQYREEQKQPKPDVESTADKTRITFGEVADLWWKGELVKQYPDHVAAKRTAELDKSRLQVLKQAIGPVPLESFTLADAERAMRALPERCRTSATRRQYAQLIVRVLSLAVYPLRIISHSPIPRGFLPKVKGEKAKVFLYPSEEALLMAHADVPIARRVFYGVLAREGMRVGELVGLQWRDLDLERGVVTLDQNKTDDPRAWALDAGVVRALKAWKKMHPNREPTGRVVLDDNGAGLGDVTHAAETFRAHLKAAGVERAQLFEHNANRIQVRVHDLRATFVTLGLANGKTETWVADRTGHKSSAMINRYRRTARAAQELGLGELLPLDEAIPELSAAGRTLPPDGGDSGQSPPESKERIAVSAGVSGEGRPFGMAVDVRVDRAESRTCNAVSRQESGSTPFESAASAIPPLRLVISKPPETLSETPPETPAETLRRVAAEALGYIEAGRLDLAKIVLRRFLAK